MSPEKKHLLHPNFIAGVMLLILVGLTAVGTVPSLILGMFLSMFVLGWMVRGWYDTKSNGDSNG